MRPTITGIAHVELSVSDVGASVAWYRRVLGAKDVWRRRNESRALKDPDGIALEFYLLRPR